MNVAFRWPRQPKRLGITGRAPSHKVHVFKDPVKYRMVTIQRWYCRLMLVMISCRKHLQELIWIHTVNSGPRYFLYQTKYQSVSPNFHLTFGKKWVIVQT